MKNRIILKSAMKIQCQHFIRAAKIVLFLLPRRKFSIKCDKMTDVNARIETLKNSSCCYLFENSIIIENSNYCTDGTVLFYSGSQSSFVTESAGKKLKIPTLRKETMIFQVFGQNDNIPKYAQVSKIKSITLLKTILTI